MFSNDNVIILSPPRAIRKYIYLCDRRFHTEHIKNLYEEDLPKYGIAYITGEESRFYNLIGDELNLLKTTIVRLPKNQKKGGQSAARISRIRDGDILRYVKLIADDCAECFTKDDLPCIDGLALIGYGDKKDKVYDILHIRLRELGVKKLSISDRVKIDDIVDTLAELFSMKNTCLNEFYDLINTNSNRVVYGPAEVNKELIEGMLKKIFIHINLLNKWQESRIEKIQEICKAKGCEFIKIKQIDDSEDKFINGFGGVGGIRWF